MKKIKPILIILSFIILTSCETKESISQEVDSLKREKMVLMKKVSVLNDQIEARQYRIIVLDEQLKERNIYMSGVTPQYILKIRLKQSRLSLDIGEHIKDAANAIEFELPVDSKFYHSVTVGTKITDEFRIGSFILNGSFSSWDMTVQSKTIK